MKLCLFCVFFVINLWAANHILLTEQADHSAAVRWANKPVLARRVLDPVESLTNWTAFTTDAPEVVDARKILKVTDATQVVATISLTRERAHDGSQSLRLRMPTRLDVAGPKSGRGWGTAGVRRHVEGEDWTAYNRLSFWIFPDCVGFQVVATELRLYNDGVEKLPAVFGQEGETTLILRNHEWNHVTWEIDNVARDKVIGLEASFLMSGSEPEASREVVYDFDELELEKVEPDYVEGWEVWPGRIAYSHVGYPSGSVKKAVASSLKATRFQLLDEASGKTVLSKPIELLTNNIGTFQIMDFSEVRTPGSFILEAGLARIRIRIGPDVWTQSVFKALNFLYAERCGMEIPGVHGICHRDWTSIHGDQRIVINGGWHDAGDLTQGLGNTAEIVYGLFSLAEKLQIRDQDSKLFGRVLEEARWGLDWILKTRFNDGFRNHGSVSSRWTDGIIGNSDDIVSTARNTPTANFTASAAEALAARILKFSDPRLAAHSLKTAESDWEFACAGMSGTNGIDSKEPWRGSFDSGDVEHEIASVGVLASLDLWDATGIQRYADKAIELAHVILDSQERNRPKWDVPLFGFFYTSPAKNRILHYCHRGREQGPTLALSRLCDAFPNHTDWMKWYSAVALYSQYLKETAKFTEPYGVMPASIYQSNEYLSVPESRRESFRKQVLNGIPLGAGHYLRLFPVWMDYRGHFGTILPQAQALIKAAHLRNDLDLANLVERQLEWILGFNPFSQSTMYGEGYDFAPLYAPFPGNITGALPVGIQTRGDRDKPYWPVQSTWTYKEVWVHPVARWIWIMSDILGPARVQGHAEAPVEFIAHSSGQRTVSRVKPVSGQFQILLSEGEYNVQSGSDQHKILLLPGGNYELDLRPENALQYSLTQTRNADGTVRLKLTAQGSGTHFFEIRTENLSIADAQEMVNLKHRGSCSLEWEGRIGNADTPWFVVAIPDKKYNLRQEITGAAWDR